MIKITLNGQQIEIEEGLNLTEFLERHSFITGKIALEINGEIAPKSSYSSIILAENMKIEIVNFVGGG